MFGSVALLDAFVGDFILWAIDDSTRSITSSTNDRQAGGLESKSMSEIQNLWNIWSEVGLWGAVILWLQYDVAMWWLTWYIRDKSAENSGAVSTFQFNPQSKNSVHACLSYNVGWIPTYTTWTYSAVYVFNCSVLLFLLTVLMVGVHMALCTEEMSLDL